MVDQFSSAELSAEREIPLHEKSFFLILFYDLNVFKKFKPKPMLLGFGAEFFVYTLGVK